jgi:hypothetical protein
MCAAFGARAVSYAADDDVVDDESGEDVAPEPAQAAYVEAVAEHGAYEPVVDADLPPECGDGEVLWHRDGLTDICAPLCSTDADCIEGMERCAALVVPGVAAPTPTTSDVLDENGAVLVEPRAFVDDDEEAADRAAIGESIAVCDPFFDLAGATEAADFIGEE